MEPLKTQFTLDREYLAECYDESLPHSKNATPNYWLPIFFLGVGGATLTLTNQPAAIGWALVALGVLELFHIRFRKAWWLARQMWGASANSEVSLTIDAEGVKTKSPYVDNTLFWSDVQQLIETDRGYILVDARGVQQYLSRSVVPTGLLQEGVSGSSNES